jgi:hypothetical protein
MLTLRPTGSVFSTDKSRQDYTASSGEWVVGYIYFEVSETDAEPRNWFWSTHGILGKPADMRVYGPALSLESAQDALEVNWQKWLAWANLEELNSTHVAMFKEQRGNP